jgi:hypothetical protein
MKSANPPLQFIFVGFESNQQGQAASQEHASSSCPETFHDDDFSSPARATADPRRNRSDETMETSLERMGDLLVLVSDAIAGREVSGRGTSLRYGACSISTGRRPYGQRHESGRDGPPARETTT